MNGKLINTCKKEWIHIRKCTDCGSRKELEFDAETEIKTYEREDGSQYKISETLECCPRCKVMTWYRK